MGRLIEALRAVRRALTSRRRAAETVGIKAVLDGGTAVATAEAAVAEVVCTGSSPPAATITSAFGDERRRETTNVFGRVLSLVETGSPRGHVAASLGLALAGDRVAAFLSGPDAATCLDQLHLAAGRHLPMVAYLICRAQAAHGEGLGSGHEAYHGVADAGWVQLFARNVQEAVDLGLVARRVAERALVPVLVAMDGEQTAGAVQDVLLPTPDLIRTYLGSAGDLIESPTPAQEMLFGRTRRRVPRWFDLERPALHGARLGAECFGLGAAANRPYFASHVAALLAEAREELARHTSRRLGNVTTHRLDDAEFALVAQGAAVESATAVADHLRSNGAHKIGVLGVSCLRPFPTDEIQRALGPVSSVVVLERADAPLAATPPLTRELRAALGSQVRTAVYGLGGLPLRAADLVAVCREPRDRSRSLVYLGVDFAVADSHYPKRQVLLEGIRRAYPAVAPLGLRAAEELDVRPASAVTIAVHRGDHATDFAATAAQLLHHQVKGRVRSRSGQRVDRFTIGDRALCDAGDETPVDVAVVLDARLLSSLATLDRVVEGGTVLVACGDDAALGEHCPPSLRQTMRARRIELFATPESTGNGAEEALGALLGLLTERFDLSIRRAGTRREEILEHLSEAERTTRRAAFDNGAQGVRRVDPESLPSFTEAAAPEHRVPAAVRRRRRSRETADANDSTPRFWDQTAILYRDGGTAELTPDPYLATGTVPPLTATFRDFTAERVSLPAFDPTRCTACGGCWTACPDGAVGPLAIGWSALLDAGIAAAKVRGAAADGLRPVVTKLAERAAKALHGNDSAADAGANLQAAFTWLIDKMAPAEDRRRTLQAAFEAVVEEVGALPVAVTSPCFEELEREQPGSGEIFSLAINPDACKGCGACIEACADDALTATAQTLERVATARAGWELWERLPDTPGATIRRLAVHPDVGIGAALGLSRHCLLAMTGGDDAEPGSGEKVVVRLVLAACEYHLQPLLQRLLEQVEKLHEQFRAQVRETMAEALPGPDLDALAEGLDATSGRHIDLAEVTAAVGDAAPVDRDRLQRLVETARELRDLRWRIAEGPSGLGRARAGLVVAPGSAAAWAGAFPYNVFSQPVMIDASGETAQLARGLLQGQLRAVLDDLHLLRRARREFERPHEAASTRGKMPPLTWQDLDDEERVLCPPVLLIGSDDVLGGRNLAALSELLTSGLPVIALSLADLDCGVGNTRGRAVAGTATDLALVSLVHRRAFVLQSSIAYPDHLVDGTLAALDHGGPALLHVHAPSPRRHGFAVDGSIEQARRAVYARAFPLLRYDPCGKGVFGSRLDLVGNPDVEAGWASDGDAGVRTLADWALTEGRFAAIFWPLEEEAPSPTPLVDYLALAANQRRSRTPFVMLVDDDGTEHRVRVADDLVAEADNRLEAWRTLQELAGLVTPFTARVREQAAHELKEAHEAEIAAMRQEHAAELERTRAELQAELTQRLQNRLATLAERYRQAHGNGGRTS